MNEVQFRDSLELSDQVKNTRMHIGVIASLKQGMEQFIFREVRELHRLGAKISIFPTKLASGLYNPLPEWNLVSWRMWKVLVSQLHRLFAYRRRYLSVLATAVRFGALSDFLLAAYFARYMHDVDSIYATFGDRKFFVGYFASRLLGLPLAVEIHAYELYQNPNPRLFKKCLDESDGIVAATEFNRDYLVTHYGISKERIEVVRYSIDLEEYRPSSKFIILIVAFFVQKKGHEILLKAVKQMGRADIEVWVVGDVGPSSSVADVHAMVDRLGMHDQVAFFGKLRDTALRAVFHACDVFCLPSRVDENGDSEGFPNAIVEAMACGRPVVTTRHVEIPRIVEQILVDENDVEGLAAALEKTYNSAELRETMGTRNRELAEQHFSAENVGQTYKLLESLMQLNR